MIYLDNNATTKIDEKVLKEMLPFLQEEYANPSSMLKASEMLLRHIARPDKADKLQKAMKICLETEKKLVITGRSTGASCNDFADYVMETLDYID